MKTRNPEARCGSCPYWRTYAEMCAEDPCEENTCEGVCVRFPVDKADATSIYRDSICGEHPDFFLPSDISDATEFQCSCGEVFVAAERMTPEAKRVIDAVLKKIRVFNSPISEVVEGESWSKRLVLANEAIHTTGRAFIESRKTTP